MNADLHPRPQRNWSLRAAAVAGRVLPARAVARQAAGGGCLLPYYHLVSDRWLPHVSPLYGFPTIRTFGRDLDYLLKFFQPIGLTEFLAAQEGAAPRGDAMLLTFDDGFREIHDVVAPLLRAKGVPAVFFLTSATVDNRLLCAHQKIAVLLDRLNEGVSAATHTEITRNLPGHPADPAPALRRLGYGDAATIDRIAQLAEVDFEAYLAAHQPYLTEEQARALLADGFAIGAHSIDHPNYAQLTSAEQLRQTTESLDDLQARLGLRHRVFAFPHSDAGVSAEFFRELSIRANPEATFGTSAPWPDPTPRHFQRFSMEKPNRPARAVLAHQAFRRLKHLLTGGRHRAAAAASHLAPSPGSA